MPNSLPVFMGYFAEDVIEAYWLMREEAFKQGAPKIDSDHALLGLVRHRNGPAAKVLSDLGLPFAKLDELRGQVRELRPRRGHIEGVKLEDIKPSLDLNQVLELTKMVMRKENPADMSLRPTTAEFLYALAIDTSKRSSIRMLLPSHFRPAQVVLQAHGIPLHSVRELALPDFKHAL